MSYEFHQINDPAGRDGEEMGAEQAGLEPIEEVEDRPVAWPSPLLYHRKPLDVSFDELESK